MTPGLAERHPLKEKRRANKPLLERKRRARINDSLADLKTLVLSSLNKDVSKYTKMEKVDILDMTVQFLKGKCFEKPIEDQMSVYRAGYTECTQQIYRSIMSMDGLDHTHKYKILSKIAERLHPDERLMTPPPSPKSFCPESTFSGHTIPCIPTHFDRSPTRQYIDPNASHISKEIDCIKNVNKELRPPSYPSNNERLNVANGNSDYCIPSYTSRYDIVHEEQFNSKLTRHSQLFSKITDTHPDKNSIMEGSSSSVWRPW